MNKRGPKDIKHLQMMIDQRKELENEITQRAYLNRSSIASNEAKKIISENGLMFTTVEAARSAIRYFRGATGTKARKNADPKLARPLDESMFNPFGLPKSDAVEFLPFVLPESMCELFCPSAKESGPQFECWAETFRAQAGRPVVKLTSWNSLALIRATSTAPSITETVTTNISTSEGVDTSQTVKRLRMNFTFFPLLEMKQELPGSWTTGPFLVSTTTSAAIKTILLTILSSSF